MNTITALKENRLILNINNADLTNEYVSELFYYVNNNNNKTICIIVDNRNDIIFNRLVSLISESDINIIESKKNRIRTSNENLIFQATPVIHSVIGFSIDFALIINRNELFNEKINEIYRTILPSISARKNSKIIIDSNKNNQLFFNLYNQAENNLNHFKVI